jgi:hypothetical protein
MRAVAEMPHNGTPRRANSDLIASNTTSIGVKESVTHQTIEARIAISIVVLALSSRRRQAILVL